MENICIRLDSALSKQIERDMKEFKYSTKTEFVREAIRDKLKLNSRERAVQALVAMRGIMKGQAKDISEEEMDKEVMKYLEKKFGTKFE